jgi:myosin heavy subunit
MEKNKDALAEALVEQMQSSSIPMLVSAPEPEQATGVGAKKKGTRMTLAAKFKLDLDNLMTALRATVPHFIRCVKPNAFVKRYKHVCLTIPGDVRQDLARYSQALLEEMEREVNYAEIAAQASGASGKKVTEAEVRRDKQWVVGKTRVFLRTAAYKLQLEKIREARASNCSVPLQKIVRGFIMRSRFVTKIAQMRKVTFGCFLHCHFRLCTKCQSLHALLLPSRFGSARRDQQNHSSHVAVARVLLPFI